MAKRVQPHSARENGEKGASMALAKLNPVSFSRACRSARPTTMRPVSSQEAETSTIAARWLVKKKLDQNMSVLPFATSFTAPPQPLLSSPAVRGTYSNVNCREMSCASEGSTVIRAAQGTSGRDSR